MPASMTASFDRRFFLKYASALPLLGALAFEGFKTKALAAVGKNASDNIYTRIGVKPLINARAETIAEKKTFKPLLDNRCLVPATAYFEWRKSGPAKLKNRIAPADGGVLAFAGLSDGERFTVITCLPAVGIAHIHDRMPAILARAAEERWIDPGLSFTEVRGLLVPFETETLEAEEETPAPTAKKDLFG